MSNQRICDTNRLHNVERELKNISDITTYIKPASGEFPQIKGIDIFGESIPYNGVCGGDHIIFVDFNNRYDIEQRIQDALDKGRKEVARKLERNKKRAGILIADVSGHQITDAVLAAMLHQSFLIGVLYELQQHGEISTQLFENLNTRFFNSSHISKFITLIYGEISEDGNFRFLNAGHPHPYVFSSKFDQLVRIYFQQVVTVQPIGTLPSQEDIDAKRNFSRLGYKKKYTTNEINLMGKGDVLLLYTDGLAEHVDKKGAPFFPNQLELVLKGNKKKSAREIFQEIKTEYFRFGPAIDDMSLVVIKKKE